MVQIAMWVVLILMMSYSCTWENYSSDKFTTSYSAFWLRWFFVHPRDCLHFNLFQFFELHFLNN